RGGEFVLIARRNSYETALGMFPPAIVPQLETFSQFKVYVPRAEIPREREVLMYCTGGIRCEKGAQYMRSLGYERVRQLHGGILAYLAQYPQGRFSGECFVFDHRVALDARLEPSARYRFCPHC